MVTRLLRKRVIAMNPERPRCVFCDRPFNNQNDLIVHTRKCREITDCKYCQANKGQMAPRHFASSRCESGRHNHCTCNICF